MTTKTPVALIILQSLAILSLVVALALTLFYAPLEAVMGMVQKIFYFHVSAGWVGMLSFLTAAIAGGLYLRSRQLLWDIISSSAVEIGLVFTLACIASGSIWAKPVWNTWWTWDPRLTTVSIMALIYAVYFILRRGIEEPHRQARLASVYVILGFITVPLTFFSIRLLRTIHPLIFNAASLAGGASLDLTPRMVHTFIISLAAFTLVYAALLWQRVRLGLFENERD